MPGFIKVIMQAAPTTHFISLAQAILFRGAGLEIVWPKLLASLRIDGVMFVVSLRRFRGVLLGLEGAAMSTFENYEEARSLATFSGLFRAWITAAERLLGFHISQRLTYCFDE